MDFEMLAIRKACEDEWTKKLRTICPYGLNEEAKGKGTNSTIVHLAASRLSPPLPRYGTRPSRSRDNCNVKSSNLNSDEFFE